MQFKKKKVEFPTRGNKQFFESKTENIKPQKIQTKPVKNITNSDLDPLGKAILTVLFAFILIICLCAFVSGCGFLMSAIIRKSIYDIKAGLFILLFTSTAIFLVFFLLMYWYRPNAKLTKWFLEKFDFSFKTENETGKLNEKEKRQLRIFVNCTIAFISSLLIIDDFISGIIISIFLIFTRKKITTGLEQILKEENNGKDS